jgi:hypothetical protein
MVARAHIRGVELKRAVNGLKRFSISSAVLQGKRQNRVAQWIQRIERDRPIYDLSSGIGVPQGGVKQACLSQHERIIRRRGERQLKFILSARELLKATRLYMRKDRVRAPEPGGELYGLLRIRARLLEKRAFLCIAVAEKVSIQVLDPRKLYVGLGELRIVANRFLVVSHLLT